MNGINDEVSPSIIMNQIRNSVRSSKQKYKENIVELNNKDYNDLDSYKMKEMIEDSIKVAKDVSNKINSNMSIAFFESRLVSRFKYLGKILTPIRKFGARLFTKWYVDPFTSQQKRLNSMLWNTINELSDLAVKQNNIIVSLYKTVSIDGEDNKRDKMLLQALKDISDIKNSIYTDFNYNLFADRFAADEETIKSIYMQYIKFFKSCNNVIDIGCGKGVFLKLLKENGINCCGIESDQKLVDNCKAIGLKVIKANAYNYIDKIDENKVDGIFMGHVIEHFTIGDRISFIKKCFNKLKYNGILIIETPNITSSYVMSNVYYLDPTHQRPLHPEALKFICEEVGFKVVNSYFSYPIKEINSNEYYNYSLILKKSEV